MPETNNNSKLTSGRLEEIANTLDFQLRFSAFAKTSNISVSVDDGMRLYALTLEALRVLKEKEKTNG